MMSSWDDTIAAVATPPGRGGVGVIRVSGPEIETLLVPLFGRELSPREAAFVSFLDASGDAIDRGIALYFPAPRSFTGESVLELHAHGNPVLLDLILKRLFELGCRSAKAGEFSQRAFLNDKIDLAQAEAVADLINAETIEGVRAATRSLNGDFSQRIEALVEHCIQLRLFVEAAIDFTDEDIDFMSEARVFEQLMALRDEVDNVLAASRRGALLQEGITLALAGKPNAGKSSLMNHLSGRDTAIVTEIAGTTRDILKEHVNLDGIPLHVIDTAGIRQETSDPIEAEGIRRAQEAFQTANRLLIVMDDRYPEDLSEILQGLPNDLPRLIIRNKIDLSGRPAGVEQTAFGTEIRLSLKTGEGIEALKTQLLADLQQAPAGEHLFMARRRHLVALEQARTEMEMGEIALNRQQTELLAEHLRAVQQSLSEISGEFSSDDLLGRIFSSFCIGK
jgi:tRNA modification GTPase